MIAHFGKRSLECIFLHKVNQSFFRNLNPESWILTSILNLQSWILTLPTLYTAVFWNDACFVVSHDPLFLSRRGLHRLLLFKTGATQAQRHPSGMDTYRWPHLFSHRSPWKLLPSLPSRHSSEAGWKRIQDPAWWIFWIRSSPSLPLWADWLAWCRHLFSTLCGLSPIGGHDCLPRRQESRTIRVE